MPLPTPPSKLGSLLPPDEYKAKARPAKAAKKSAEGDASTAGDYGPASVAQPMIEAANTAAPLRAVASSAPDAAPARGRKTKQTAALLQPM
ncbi:PhoH family protein, partial [Burkholderia sp. Tr-20355]|nr:PhoH family protein [Burkholderia sp. Tr-20355]